MQRRYAYAILLTCIALMLVTCTANIAEDLNTRLPLFRSQLPDVMGFVALRAIPKEAKPGLVIIWAPDNCPREAGQRAEQLVTALEAAQIPHLRISVLTYGSSIELSLIAYFLLRDQYKDMEQPIVMLDNYYRANPSPDLVIQRYRWLYPSR